MDMLRGVCLVEMMANHLPRNIVTRTAVETVGFVSAAEGFVFVSGFISGRRACCALAANRPLKFVTQHMVFRAAQIYAVYLFLLTVLLTSIKLGGSHLSEWAKLCHLGTESVGHAWLYGVVLLYFPEYLDIFSIYCVFLLLVPIMIAQIRAGWGWLVLTISVGLWAFSQFWQPSNPPALLQNFNLLSWQLLFTFGVTLGYDYDTGENRPNPARWSLLLCGLLCLALFMIRQSPRLGVLLPAVNAFNLVQKSTLGAIRLLNFAALAYILRALLRWLGPELEDYWPHQKLAFLGQHSLQVFAWSLGTTYLAYLSGESWWHFSFVVQMCLAGTAIVMLWVPAWLHGEWRVARRKKPSLHC